MRAQPERAEAIGNRDPGQTGEVAEGPDAEPLERSDQAPRLTLGPRQPVAQQGDRQGLQKATRHRRRDHRRPAPSRAGLAGDRVGAEAGRSTTDPDRGADHRGGLRQDALRVRPPESAEPADREEDLTGPGRLGLGADPFQPAQRSLPE